MVFFKYIILFILFISSALKACPNLQMFYDALQKAEEYFLNKNYLNAIKFYEKIDTCEKFYNTEKNLYYFAISLWEVCKNHHDEQCDKYLNKSETLLLKSIELLKPAHNFKKELSERYFYLGWVYIRKNECYKATKSFYQSYLMYPQGKSLINYKNLKKICNN
jgi:tetratricopeptide (TPR) repeat protein